MKLLLFILLSPVMLFGQTRRAAIADSMKAAGTDLQGISRLLNNSPGTGIDAIHVSDSGEYITMVIRVHTTEIMTTIPCLPIAPVSMEAIVASEASTQTIPPLPAIVEGEPVTTLSLSAIPVADMTAAAMNTLTVPPLPPFTQAEPIPTLPVSIIPTRDIMAAGLNMRTAPPLPPLTGGDPIPTLEQIPFLVQDIRIAKMDTLTIPPMPDMEWGIIEVIPCLPAVVMTIAYSPAGKMDTVTVHSYERPKLPVTGMHLSDEGYSLLEKLEGFSPKPYALGDGGLTIGFGFFIPFGEISKWSKGVTWDKAEQMIRDKVPAYEDQVKQYINVPLTQNEFDALTMLAYNLGGFSKATSIVNDVNRLSDYDKLQSDWKRFIHSKAPGVTRGLLRRRRDELGVRNAADYQPERKIQILKN